MKFLVSLVVLTIYNPTTVLGYRYICKTTCYRNWCDTEDDDQIIFRHHYFRVTWLSWIPNHQLDEYLRIKVIMEYGDTKWFDVPIERNCARGHICDKVLKQPYRDSSKELYGIILGFLVQTGWRKGYLFGMQVGTSNYSEYPDEVPSCVFNTGVNRKPTKFIPDVTGCVYNRNSRDNDYMNCLEKKCRKQAGNSKVYKSANSYKQWDKNIAEAFRAWHKLNKRRKDI